MDLEDTRHIERGDGHAQQPENSDGWAYVGGRTAGRRGKIAVGWRQRNIFSGKGCVSLRRGVPGRDKGVRQGLNKMVRFGTYNIRSGRNGGLESALRGLGMGQVNCGVLQ